MRMALNMHHAACFPKLRLITMPCTMLPLPLPPNTTAAAVVPRSLIYLRSGSQAVSSSSSTSRAGGLRSVGYKFEPPDISSSLALNSNGDGNTASRVMPSDAHSSLMASDAHSSSGVCQLTTVGKASDVAIDSELRKAAKQSSSGDVYSGERTKPSVQVMRRTLLGHQDRRNYSEHQVSLSRNATSRLSMFGSDVPWPSVQALKDAQSCLEERLPHDLPGYSPRPGSSEFTSAESRKPVFLEKASTAMPNGGGLPWLKKVEEMNAETRNSGEKSEGNDSVLDDGRAVSTSNVAKKGLDVEPEHIQRLCVEGEHKREPSSEEFFLMKEELVIPPILGDRSKKQFLSRGIRGVSPVTGSQTFGKISDTVSPTMPETKTENGLGNGQPSRGGTSESVMTLTVENVVAEESLTMKCEYAVPSLIQDKNQFSSSSIKDGSRESGFESVATTSLVYSEAVLPNYLVCQPENSSRIQFDNCADELQASQKTKTSEIEGRPQEGKSFFHPPFKDERHSKIEHATPRIRSQSNQENSTAELKVDPDLINHQKIGQHAIRIKKKGAGSSGSAKKVNQHNETSVTGGRITQLSPQMPDLERATQKVEEASLLQGSSDEKIVNPKSSDVRMLQVSKLKDSTDVKLVCSMEDVVIINNVADARNVVSHLRVNCKELIHACDTEVTDINVKKESPVGHGKVICFSIYCGPQANFGSGKTGVWVDVLDGGEEIIAAFKEYFEDPSIKKVWHNFSFDKHVLGNHGIKAQGFYADTMHLARLWNSGRKGAEGGYSLESLTGDPKVMDGAHSWKAHEFTKKTSMKDLFGVNNIKKDGTEGKLKSLPPVVELQRSDHSRDRWICYSVGDAMSTWRLWESLQAKLRNTEWVLQGKTNGTMYDFYEAFWQPFGELLTQMEAEGMLVDRCYLAEIEKTAVREQHVSASRFRKWATKYCPDAQYINVTSDCQVRQLLFGGVCAKRMSQEAIPVERIFNVPNVDEYIEEGRKAPKKSRRIKIRGIGFQIPVNQYTNNGLPAVSIQALKEMAGKVSVDYSYLEEAAEEQVLDDEGLVLTSTGVKGGTDNESMDKSLYGTAYPAFGGGEKGKEACEAIAALCEVSAIDTLISNFIHPLQGGDILGPDGRVHCSLNLNTETGRLSARRPNLQNQPALEKDRYKIRQAFIASPGNSLIVADYGQLELRILAHLANCKSMLQAFKVGGDFHSRTAMNMYDHVRKAVENKEVLLEWEPKPGDDSPPAPLLKDIFGSERRKAKMLNFSIAYGKTAIGLAKDWKVTLDEAKETLDLWYKDRHEVRVWQDKRKEDARVKHCVHTLLGRARHFPDVRAVTGFWKGHIERAAINTPVQGSAADVAMCAMLEIAGNAQLRELGWKLLLQIHDEVILEGPTNTAELAKDLVVKAMSYPFKGKNFLNVELAVDAKFAESWYAAK